MAVVQISRIQHRSGVSDNLPQLARGEIGLAVDTRKVYIGNGGSNAPAVENIEFLTTRSNVIGLADTYTYKDDQIGFSAQTGVSASSPVTRTLQQKFDDIASVRDFGAVGDGTTDDTLAINRALYELFAREQIIRVRRSLFFPAGKYKITDTIKIPTYAKLVGEGPESTIIEGSHASNPTAQTADSLQQISASVGSNSAVRPSNIVVSDITFSATTDVDIMAVDQAEGIFFTNCNFIGAKTTAPTGVGNTKAGVKLTSTTNQTTRHVSFSNCKISGNSLGVIADNDMQSINFDNCLFSTCFKAIKLGESVTGSAPSVNGPRSVKITNSLFDNVYHHAIHVYDGDGFVSAFNYFDDCGNNALGSGNPTQHVINFAVGTCQSIGDYFERPDADDTSTTRRVNVDTGHVAGLAFDNAQGIKLGGYIRGYGKSITLDNNSSKSTGISFSDNTDENAIEIEYAILRNSKWRQGCLRITHDSSAQTLDEDYSENNGSVGVTFSLTNGSNITTLNYTTTNDTTGTFYYSIRTIR